MKTKMEELRKNEAGIWGALDILEIDWPELKLDSLDLDILEETPE